VCDPNVVTDIILPKIETALSQIQNSISTNKTVLSLNVGIFIITITGFLLEYPAIYFHGGIQKNNSQQNLENCLSMIPLKLYQLKITPTNGLNISGDKILLSCSIPAEIEDTLEIDFTSYFQDTFLERIHHKNIWKNFRVIKTPITMPQYIF